MQKILHNKTVQGISLNALVVALLLGILLFNAYVSVHIPFWANATVLVSMFFLAATCATISTRLSKAPEVEQSKDIILETEATTVLNGLDSGVSVRYVNPQEVEEITPAQEAVKLFSATLRFRLPATR